MSDDELPAPVEPTPDWQVVVTNLLVMAFALLLLPQLVAGFWHWDPCSAIGGVMFGAPTLWLGLSAYGSLARRHAKAADAVMVGSFAVAGVACIPFLGILSQARGLGDLGAGLMMAAVAATAVWCGLVNRRWTAELKGPPKPYDPVANYHAVEARRRGDTLWNWEPHRFTLREALLAVVVLAWVFGVARWHVQSMLPQSAEHVGREACPMSLPLDATDVAYSQSYRGGIQVEFTCSEESFLRWFEEDRPAGGEFGPIGAPAVVHVQGPVLDTQEIRRGWRYVRTWKPDNFLHVTYDADKQRAYYHRVTY